MEPLLSKGLKYLKCFEGMVPLVIYPPKNFPQKCSLINHDKQFKGLQQLSIVLLELNEQYQELEHTHPMAAKLLMPAVSVGLQTAAGAAGGLMVGEVPGGAVMRAATGASAGIKGEITGAIISQG